MMSTYDPTIDKINSSVIELLTEVTTKMTEESSTTVKLISTLDPTSDGTRSWTTEQLTRITWTSAPETNMTTIVSDIVVTTREDDSITEVTPTVTIPAGSGETGPASPDDTSADLGIGSSSPGSSTVDSTEIESSPYFSAFSSSRSDTSSSSVQTSATTSAVISTDLTTAGYHTTVVDNNTSSGLSQSAIIGIAVGVSLAVVLVLVILVVVVLRKRRMGKRKKYTEEENVNDYKLDIHHDTVIKSPSATNPRTNNLFIDDEQLVDGESLEMVNSSKVHDDNDNPLWRGKSNTGQLNRALAVESRMSLGPMILGFDDPESPDADMNTTNTFR